MLSKNKIKLFHSLKRKKTRAEKKLFVAEGEKCVLEILNSELIIPILVATEEWIKKNSFIKKVDNILEIISEKSEEINKISNFKTVSDVILIASQPEYKFSYKLLNNNFTIVLDNIQDPGNMGSIIRTASWFGINTIICSRNSVDIFNHKVIQSTMGAICKLNIFYMDILDLLKENSLPVYGTFLNGDNIYNHNLDKEALIIMGNEGSGISKELSPFITNRITIPSFSENKIESLNISSATAIVCSEFKRRINYHKVHIARQLLPRQ